MPGEIYEYAIDLSPTASVFQPGHRLKLLVMSLDHPRALAPTPEIGASHLPYHLCSSKTTIHRIYHDPERPSYLLLPIIPRG